MPKENRRTQMTKLLLRTALIELMQEKPISQITIRALCEKADLNRTTFYLHYTDQMALLRDVEQEVLHQTVEHMQHIHTDRRTTKLVSAFLEYVQKNDLTFRTLLCRDESEGFRRRFVETLMRMIGSELPMYGDDVRTQYVLSFLMYGSLYVIIQWVESGYKESVEQIAKLLFDLNESVDENHDLHM
ncbi:MAG: TetR family transcriptional regulator C-terminal domain-containing protein [Clostridiales bacterium]|nr:TetR family transcriptional regulator C-terminal domain-containing protein [Clostridiales bacterium]